MKLNEAAIDWNNVSEKEQIEWVKKKYMNIRKISNPSLRVQLAAIYPHGHDRSGPGGGWPMGLAMQYI